MQNKKIPTCLGTIILLIIALSAGVFVWKWEKENRVEEMQIQNMVTKKRITENNWGQEEKNSQRENISNQQNSINWATIQFNDCRNKEKYGQMSWWNKFVTEIEKINYYSNSFIESQLESANNNTYLNPEKTIYTYQAYCDDERNKNRSICIGKDRKLSMDNFNNYGEGCLSNDGSAFIAVFPGEYLGGGNYIFRYDVTNNILEETQKIINDYTYWASPPTAFGKITGNIIRMIGATGDAGCSLDTAFDYDIVSNQIKLIRKCMQCINERQDCKTFLMHIKKI